MEDKPQTKEPTIVFTVQVQNQAFTTSIQKAMDWLQNVMYEIIKDNPEYTNFQYTTSVAFGRNHY